MPTTTRRRIWRWNWADFSYRSLIFFLFFLVFIALLAALYDTAQQLWGSNRVSKVSDLVITFGTYAVIIVVGAIIMISRRWSVRAAVASIPKGYIPTKQEDVPKSAHELISSEYDRASVIAHVSQPKGRQQDGWGRPGTESENVHFRTAILATISILQFSIAPFYPNLPAPSRASPLSPLAPLFALSPSPFPPALNPLAELYEEYLVKAKYGEDEPSEQDWDATVKIVAVFVGLLSGSQNQDGSTAT